MVDLSQVVWTTSLNANPGTVSLPRPLMVVYAGFYRVHRFWRMYQNALIYSNPNNFAALATGHALNYIAGDKIIVRMSAIAVLIANRITMVVDQIYRLEDSVRKLKNNFSDEYSKVVKYEHVNTSLLSPSAFSDAKWCFKRSLHKIKRIANDLFRIFKEAFLLSMRMIDAIETFYMSPDTRDEWTNQLFVNGSQLLDALEGNQRNLQKSLKKCKPIIDNFLQAIDSQFTADKFIELSCDALDTAFDVHITAQQISSPFVDFVQEVGKRALYGYATFLGLTKLVPKRLYPNYTCTPVDMGPATHFAPDYRIKVTAK